LKQRYAALRKHRALFRACYRVRCGRCHAERRRAAGAAYSNMSRSPRTATAARRYDGALLPACHRRTSARHITRQHQQPNRPLTRHCNTHTEQEKVLSAMVKSAQIRWEGQEKRAENGLMCWHEMLISPPAENAADCFANSEQQPYVTSGMKPIWKRIARKCHHVCYVRPEKRIRSHIWRDSGRQRGREIEKAAAEMPTPARGQHAMPAGSARRYGRRAGHPSFLPHVLPPRPARPLRSRQ